MILKDLGFPLVEFNQQTLIVPNVGIDSFKYERKDVTQKVLLLL